MTYDVHIGSPSNHLQTCIGMLRGFSSVQAVYTDGDGWEEWGDPPGTGVNDTDTQHVIARVDTLGQAIDLAMSLADLNGPIAGSLIPLRESLPPGLVVTVSQSTDWAEQFFDVTASGDARTLRNQHVEW